LKGKKTAPRGKSSCLVSFERGFRRPRKGKELSLYQRTAGGEKGGSKEAFCEADYRGGISRARPVLIYIEGKGEMCREKEELVDHLI